MTADRRETFNMLSYRPDRNKRKATLQDSLYDGTGTDCKRVYLSASLTVEAALVLPLFLFLMVLLLEPLRCLEAERRMEARCDSLCASISQTAYALNRDEKAAEEAAGSLGDSPAGREAGQSGGSILTEVLKFTSGLALGKAAASEAAEAAADGRVGNMSSGESAYMDGSDDIRIRLDYAYTLPFAVLGRRSIDRSVIAVRRAWIGKKRDSGEGNGREDTDDPWVYVGKTSTRYHLDSRCHYLYNDLKAVSLETARTSRNASGGKYAPCSVCGGGAVSGQTVYIMPGGSAYHTDSACRAIGAYVRCVHLSEVEYLGPCSYCGK